MKNLAGGDSVGDIDVGFGNAGISNGGAGKQTLIILKTLGIALTMMSIDVWAPCSYDSFPSLSA